MNIFDFLFYSDINTLPVDYSFIEGEKKFNIKDYNFSYEGWSFEFYSDWTVRDMGGDLNYPHDGVIPIRVLASKGKLRQSIDHLICDNTKFYNQFYFYADNLYYNWLDPRTQWLVADYALRAFQYNFKKYYNENKQVRNYFERSSI